MKTDYEFVVKHNIGYKKLLMYYNNGYDNLAKLDYGLNESPSVMVGEAKKN